MKWVPTGADGRLLSARLGLFGGRKLSLTVKFRKLKATTVSLSLSLSLPLSLSLSFPHFLLNSPYTFLLTFSLAYSSQPFILTNRQFALSLSKSVVISGIMYSTTCIHRYVYMYIICVSVIVGAFSIINSFRFFEAIFARLSYPVVSGTLLLAA